MGRNLETMLESVAAQDYTPVTAARPMTGPLVAAQMVPQRKIISAHSFRKLTALLKSQPTPSEDRVGDDRATHAISVFAFPALAEAETTAQPAPFEKFEPEYQPSAQQHYGQAEPQAIAEPEIVKPERVEQAIYLQSAELAVVETVAQPKPNVSSSSKSPFDAGLPIPTTPTVQQSPEQDQEAAELARTLLDMMAASSSSGLPQERALAADTLLRMLPRLPVKSLILLSERVRLMDSPPPLLMAKLIADPNIAVSGPLLEDCMHITDQDLVMVIGDGDVAKIRMIARRRRLSRAIATALVATADSSVLLTLVRNLGAELPQDVFTGLADHASKHADLLAPLCTRPDLPVPFAFELFWLAPAQLRRYILSRFLTDSETLTKILKIARGSAGDETAEPKFAKPEAIVAALTLAGEGDVDGAAAALAAMAQIDPATVLRVLNDDQGEPLIALLKVIGLPRGMITEIFTRQAHSNSRIIDPSREVDELQSVFDSLSFNKARILITYWDWATLKSGPYAPLN